MVGDQFFVGESLRREWGPPEWASWSWIPFSIINNKRINNNNFLKYKRSPPSRYLNGSFICRPYKVQKWPNSFFYYNHSMQTHETESTWVGTLCPLTPRLNQGVRPHWGQRRTGWWTGRRTAVPAGCLSLQSSTERPGQSSRYYQGEGSHFRRWTSEHDRGLGFHLRDPGVYGASRVAVEDVHAALALVLQRGPNGQVIDPVLVEVREGSHGGSEPSSLPRLSSQDDRLLKLAVHSLAGTHGSDWI